MVRTSLSLWHPLSLWRDDAGILLSAEAVLLGTTGVLAAVVGLNLVATAVNDELTDLAFAFRSLDQSYYVAGHESYTAGTAAFGYVQEPVAVSHERLRAEQARLTERARNPEQYGSDAQEEPCDDATAPCLDALPGEYSRPVLPAGELPAPGLPLHPPAPQPRDDSKPLQATPQDDSPKPVVPKKAVPVKDEVNKSKKSDDHNQASEKQHDAKKDSVKKDSEKKDSEKRHDAKNDDAKKHGDKHRRDRDDDDN